MATKKEIHALINSWNQPSIAFSSLIKSNSYAYSEFRTNHGLRVAEIAQMFAEKRNQNDYGKVDPIILNFICIVHDMCKSDVEEIEHGEAAYNKLILKFANAGIDLNSSSKTVDECDLFMALNAIKDHSQKGIPIHIAQWNPYLIILQDSDVLDHLNPTFISGIKTLRVSETRTTAMLLTDYMKKIDSYRSKTDVVFNFDPSLFKEIQKNLYNESIKRFEPKMKSQTGGVMV